MRIALLKLIDEAEIREFLLHQLASGKFSSTVNIYNSALRFIFGAVLARNFNCRMIHRRRDRRDFPTIMSKNEIVRFFSVIDRLRDLAISEIVHLRVQDIDSEQMRIFVYHGKGGKD